MAQKIFMSFVSMVVVALTSCTEEAVDNNLIPIPDDPQDPTIEYLHSTITHNVVGEGTNEVIDDMEATVKVNETVAGVVENSYELTATPKLNAGITVEKTDYTISIDQVDCIAEQPTITNVDGQDLIVFNINDGQVVTTTSNISAVEDGQTLNGQKFSFGTIKLHNAKMVSIENEKVNDRVYNTTYTVELSYEELNVDAPKEINIKLTAKAVRNLPEVKPEDTPEPESKPESDFPAEWGKFAKAVCTVAADETGNDWVYTWSLHFEKGTLPVVIRKDDSSASIDESLFEYITNSDFNGGVYKDKWVNSVAKDHNTYMQWCDGDNVVLKSIDYRTSRQMGWNNGTQSVFTDAFVFSVSNNVLTITKDGNPFASYNL